jgi:cation diffusion facilitator CzcD-associated flavoprotein CzcO
MADQIPFFDVIIVGAGISGIGAAWHLLEKSPNRTYTILEGRSSMGGTWDLFRYPGIRSDSDMHTLGFSFNPWENPKAIADGPSILQYIKDTAAKFGIDKHIQYNKKVTDASWSDKDACWTLTIAPQDNQPETKMQCRFFFSCSGYYDYDKGYLPEFPGQEHFKGRFIHPQQWDESLDYTNKKVVIIGSGATAVTLVPEMSKLAEKVYMLQRTPTYVVTLPSEDVIAQKVRKILPSQMAYDLVRWKNILLSMSFYNAARQWPDAIRKLLLTGVKRQLGSDFDMRHFSPPYNPWDQRLCVVPDADLFKSIKQGKVEVVTDTIKTFSEKGIILNSGRELEADIIVTATGLRLQLLGGMTMHVNGQLVDSSKGFVYRGMMLSGVPNFAMTVGYTNSSWTLKVDLVSHFVTRILNHMEKHGYKVCLPQFKGDNQDARPLLDFSAGYVQRAAKILPKQGSKDPWKVYQNYILDLFSLRLGDVKEKHLVYR